MSKLVASLVALVSLVCAGTVYGDETPVPGLKQYRLTSIGGTYMTPDTWQSKWDKNDPVVMPGALMARSGNFNGTTWKEVNYPLGNQSGYWYEGYIRLVAGKTYSAASYFDDGGCVYIDGQMVYNQGTASGYNASAPSFTPQPFVCTKTGWYHLQLGIWDWGGGRGIYGGTIAVVQWSDADPDVAKTDYGATYWNEFWDADADGNPAGTYLYTGDPSGGPNMLSVAGAWDEEAGWVSENLELIELTPGSAKTLTMSGETHLHANGLSRMTCIGWTAVTTAADGTDTQRSGGADELTFDVSVNDGERVRVEWQWKTEHFVTVTAGTGGTASPAETWVEAGKSLSISATASEGYSFYRWSGDANAKDAEIELTVDCPKSVKALFATETHVSTKGEFTTALTEALASVKGGEIGAETIWLADGNYQLAAKTTIDVPIRIRGESDDPTKVVFSPDKKDTHEMFVLAHADAALSGLTVQGGYGTGGQSYSTYGGAQGADVTITSAGGTVENCILRNAKGGNGWGTCASALKQGGGLVSRCVISNCSSSCAWGNYCSYGNAALVYGGVMENTLITKNSGGGSDAGGGAICLAGTGKMINCTVAGNSMNGYAGIFIDGTSAKAINCLICNNTSAHRTENYAGVYNGSSVASYFTACVAPVQINGSCHTAAGLGLKDAGHGDYHPILGSVCLDNGTLDGITPSALDLDGNARIDEDSGKIDVGCYELVLEGIAASITCTPADTQGLVPVTRTFSSIVQGGTPTAYEWSINGEVLPGETGDTLSRTFTKAGSYTVSLKVSDAKGTYDAVNDVLITALPTNVYVDAKSATPVAPYDTPETAAKTFADAYAAAGDYSVILIAPNNYSRTSQITIDKKVTVRGTGKSPLDTILSLKNVSNVRVMQLNSKEALVCNLTLEGGRMNGQNSAGMGVYIADKGGTVSNCVIRNCKGTGLDTCGGGAYIGCADALITHCVFTNCSVVGNACGQNAWERGGFAASITAGSLRDSLIVGCYQDGLNATQPGDDGAVAMHGGKLVNCTIVGCRAEECAGIRAGGGQVINCIVSGNTTTSSNPTNAVWRGSGTTVRNSLADQDVGGKFLMEETALTFVGTGTHRYRLRTGSKAIDAGDSSAVTSTVDLRGNPRILCGAVDLGCYEKKIGLTVLVK